MIDNVRDLQELFKALDQAFKFYDLGVPDSFAKTQIIKRARELTKVALHPKDNPDAYMREIGWMHMGSASDDA